MERRGQERGRRGEGEEEVEERRRLGLTGPLTSFSCTFSSLTATTSLLISYLPWLFFQAARGLARVSRVLEHYSKMCLVLQDQDKKNKYIV